jgi:hypothetical protein
MVLGFDKGDESKVGQIDDQTTLQPIVIREVVGRRCGRRRAARQLRERI